MLNSLVKRTKAPQQMQLWTSQASGFARYYNKAQ